MAMYVHLKQSAKLRFRHRVAFSNTNRQIMQISYMKMINNSREKWEHLYVSALKNAEP